MILDETMHCCESDMECCWKFWSISLSYIKFSEVGINVKVAIRILFIFNNFNKEIYLFVRSY